MPITPKVALQKCHCYRIQNLGWGDYIGAVGSPMGLKDPRSRRKREQKKTVTGEGAYEKFRVRHSGLYTYW
jgi:hypothetical protein